MIQIYKKDRYAIIISFVTVTIISYIYKPYLSNEIAQNIITIVSIFFGSYMTSLAVLVGTGYSKKLYQEEDKILNKQTRYATYRKIHTVRDYSKLTSIISVSTVLFVLVFLILTTRLNPKNANYQLIIFIHGLQVDIGVRMWSSIIYGMVIINFYMTFIFIKFLINTLVHESSSS